MGAENPGEGSSQAPSIYDMSGLKAVKLPGGWLYTNTATAPPIPDGKWTQDAVCYGTNIVTSASANFSAADVGKIITLSNGGTVFAVNASIVNVQSATAITISVAAAGSGTNIIMNWGTDLLVPLTNWINSINGFGQLPTGRYCCSGTINITASGLTVEGGTSGKVPASYALGGNSLWFPENGLNGTVIVCMGSACDAIGLYGLQQSVSFKNLGITFASAYNNTGHGINATPPTYLARYDNGPSYFTWSNINVLGHDGNHYAFNLVNPIIFTLNQLSSWGGGSVQITGNGYNDYGNGLILNCQSLMFVGGSAHCWNIVGSQSAAPLNFLTWSYLGAAVLTLGQLGTSNANYPGLVGPTAGTNLQFNCPSTGNYVQYMTINGLVDWESHLAASYSTPVLPFQSQSFTYAVVPSDGVSTIGAINTSPVSGTSYYNGLGCSVLYLYTVTLNGLSSGASATISIGATNAVSTGVVSEVSVPTGTANGAIYTLAVMLTPGYYFQVNLINATGVKAVALRFT